MKNKRVISLICFAIGTILVILCMLGKEFKVFETYKALFGIMLGLGSGLIGGSIGHLINMHLLAKNPDLKKKKEIEETDERNIYISSKVKSKAFNTMGFVFPTAIFICILLDADFVITIVLLIAYLLIYIVYIYYFNKYLKEM